MEELLFKALREYRQIEGEARKAGVEVPPAEREAFFRSQTGGQFGWEDAERTLGGIDTSRNVRNLLWSAVQGGLFNFGDEAVGLLNPRAAEKRRLEEEMFREQHPATDMAAGIAGGAATGIGAGLALGKSGAQLGARTLGQIARRGAAAGAGAG